MNKERLGAVSGACGMVGVCAALFGIVCYFMPMTPAPAAAKVTPSKSLSSAPAGTYKLDPDQAYITFRFDHLDGLSRPAFRFRKAEAEYVWDPAQPEATTLEVRLMPTYIDTGNAQLDVRLNASHILRGFDFGDNGKYRYITFSSREVRFKQDGSGQMLGDMTLFGVTQPVTIEFTYNGYLSHDGVGRMGFSGRGSLQRSHFGMTSVPEAGDRIDFETELEFLRDDSASREYIKNRRDDPRG